MKTIIVSSNCLPYYRDDGMVSIWIGGKKMIVPQGRFRDITTEAGYFMQYYTFQITQEEGQI